MLIIANIGLLSSGELEALESEQPWQEQETPVRELAAGRFQDIADVITAAEDVDARRAKRRFLLDDVPVAVKG